MKVEEGRPRMLSLAKREILKVKFLIRSVTVRNRLRTLFKSFDRVIDSIDLYEKSKIPD